MIELYNKYAGKDIIIVGPDATSPSMPVHLSKNAVKILAGVSSNDLFSENSEPSKLEFVPDILLIEDEFFNIDATHTILPENSPERILKKATKNSFLFKKHRYGGEDIVAFSEKSSWKKDLLRVVPGKVDASNIVHPCGLFGLPFSLSISSWLRPSSVTLVGFLGLQSSRQTCWCIEDVVSENYFRRAEKAQLKYVHAVSGVFEKNNIPLFCGSFRSRLSKILPIKELSSFT